MAKYRIRSCPHCGYYMVFSVAIPASAARGSAVTSFCLNCGYKLPVQRVLLSVRRAASRLRPRPLRLAKSTPAGASTPTGHSSSPATPEKSGNRADYSRHLRAIGQDLENLRLTKFNLECTGPLYLVWTRGDAQDAKPGSRSLLSNPRLRRLWKNRAAPRSQGEEEYVALTPLRRVTRYRYTRRHIDNIEQAARTRRRLHNGSPDGHSLSQLLRSAGALIEQRSRKLLGIAWQETSVSIVFEDESGRRGIDIFRPDELYDFWVKMHLQRNDSALAKHSS